MRPGSGPGPASIEGLRWLCRVGAAPLDAWRLAMGWAPGNARSHVARLTRAGWLARVARPLGQGSLYYATPLGVRVAGVDLPAAPAPAPTWWDHHDASAWVAAWLSVRGREMIGPRELIASEAWRAELAPAPGAKRVIHTPDLIGTIPGHLPAVVEVELTRKSRARLQAILGLYLGWIAAGKIGACVYVCGNADVHKLVLAQAQHVGLGDGRLRLETLEAIKEIARREAGVPRGTPQTRAA